MNPKAIDIVQKCLDTQNPYLDLGRMGLTDEDFAAGTKLDRLLRQCTHLQTLILSNYWTEWDDFGELREYNSSNNGNRNILYSIPTALKKLDNLVTLTIFGDFEYTWNSLDLPFRLVKLIIIGSIEVKEILKTRELIFDAGFVDLKQLYVESYEIGEIRGLDSLVNIEELYLADNSISEIKWLSKLKKLKRLDLTLNKIKEIKYLENATELSFLSLGYNQISEIKGLNELKRLNILYLNDNQISEIKGLDGLHNLRELLLNGNQIREIKGLGGLTNLQELYLHDNQLNEIKGLDFIKRKDSFKLILNDNPLVEKYQLKLVAGENHFPFIKDWLLRQDSKEKRVINYPIKVLLLGNHEAGKSSLVDMLIGIKSNGSTHILRIANYTIDRAKAALGQLPDAVFYDFGGQDFYHGLYRAFISSGGLQMVIFNSAKDWNGYDKDRQGYDIINFDRHYWLGQKKHTANTDPYIMVQTYADENGATDAPDVDYACYPGYKKRFFLSLNDKLNQEQKQDEPFYAAGKRYFTTYFNGELKKLLLKQEHNEPQWYINFLTYIFDKTNTSHLPNPLDEVLKQYKDERPIHERREALKRTLTLLHRHGLVLYYDTEGLQNDVWLNPEALVQYIQQEVLKKESIKTKKGVIPKTTFESSILSDKKIRMLLLKQKVIFLHQPTYTETDGEYIIPNYLPLASDSDSDYQLFVFGLQQPDFTIKFNDFIPFGFINQMICFYGQQPDAKKFWRNQLLFTLNKEARVLIQMDFATLQVKVHIQLIANADVNKDKVATYLFYSLLALYWDKIDLDTLPQYHYHMQDNSSIEIAEERYGPLADEQKGGEGSKNSGKYLSAQMVLNQFEQWEYLQQNEANIPADAYLSVDGNHFIYYKDLFNLKEDYTINSYLMGSNGRIDITKRKEIAAAPFSAFTHNKIPVMKKLFISYSKHDEEYKEEFRKHLITLKEQKLISSFNCKEIDLGADWDETIQRELDECNIVICLVSVDFLNTDYIRKYEVEKAIEKGKQVIPIIIKPCDWEPSNIGKLFAPNRGKSISLDQELFLRNIIKETTPIERAAWWVAIVKEMREKLFK